MTHRSPPLFQQRHYVHMAEWVRNTMPADPIARGNTGMYFVNMLKGDNPSFKPKKFLAACGLNEYHIETVLKNGKITEDDKWIPL